MAKILAVVPRLLAGAAVAVWLGAAAPESHAQPAALDQEILALNPEEREELFVFVAGNALFTLYHEAGHMLVSELGLPVLAQEEDAVDNLATVSMLAADNDDMDLFLTQAMIGWFLIAEEDYDDLIFYGEHDLDQQRGYTILCLMVGADEDAFLELAGELGLPEERIETCGFDYEQAAASWEAVTDSFLRDGDAPGGKISVVHDPAPDELAALALFLKESELMELVAEEFDTLYDLPENVTFRAAECGIENAFWDPDRREVVLCHELLGGFADIYLGLLLEDAPDE
ncbi:MAG: hypothetical protein Tsb0019_17770 [Roseibium sp.]